MLSELDQGENDVNDHSCSAFRYHNIPAHPAGLSAACSSILQHAHERWLYDVAESLIKINKDIQNLSISPELRKAYENAAYQVETPSGSVILKVGALTPNGLFADAEAGSNVSFVTASNPFSRQLSAAENADRHKCLKASVAASGYRMLPGIGSDPTGEWPSEVSVAVFNPTAADTDNWMRMFEQYAVADARLGFAVKLRFHPMVSAEELP